MDETSKSPTLTKHPRCHTHPHTPETPRKVARWDADPCYDGSPRYVLSPPHWRDDLMHPRWQYATTREQAIAWGYTIEGGPEPIDDTAPERLRERREALGKDDGWIEHILDGLDVGAGPDFGHGRERRIAAEGRSNYTEKSTATIRAAYAAALSAAEAERAAKPERPAPRFKVGDWVRWPGDEHAWQVTRVTWLNGCWMCSSPTLQSADFGLEPASPPAPEVVDVPQPETWHARLVRLATEAQAAGKACAEAEAAFTRADADREKARLARAASREVCHVKRQALTEATAAASIIRDAQQGGAS